MLSEIHEIIGVVKKSQPTSKERNAPRLFNIVSNTSQREYQILCPFICPTRRGDVIVGYCVKETNGEFVFIRCPTVEPPSSREAIQTAFIIGLGKLRIPRYLSDRLYEFFIQEANKRLVQMEESHQVSVSESPIHRKRTSINAAVMEMISWYAFTFRSNPEIIAPILQVGLTAQQAEKLLRWWYREQIIRRLYLLGLTRKEIKECCERGWAKGPVWENSPSALYYQLLENPYAIEKLPLAKADEIVRRYDLSFDQNIIEAANLVRFVDTETIERKWACYPVYSLIKKFPRFHELETTLKRYFHCVIRYNFFYLRYQAEIEDLLTELLESEESEHKTYASERTKKELCPEQIDAIELILNNTVSIVTGGAGTGKTRVISALSQELELRKVSYCIVSFTGKAVARVKEMIGKTSDIMTLHMLLTKSIAVPYEYLIVDEVSMVPNELIAKVLMKLHYAQPAGGKLKVVMVGDPNQVEPIEWGDLFNQILEAGVIPRVDLTVDHRRSDFGGVLYQNTQQFALAECPDEIRFEWGSDCEFIQGQLPQLEALLRTLHNEGVSHKNITIVSPYKNLDDINGICQNIFLPSNAPYIRDTFDKLWKIGARVMMTEKNFYDLGVMNGDEGIITQVNQNYLRVLFHNGQDVKIPTFVPVISEDDDDYERDEPLSTRFLALSWAVTIHKSQGSEWEHIIFFVREGRSSSSFFNRKLLYTGLSRAKSHFYVVANAKTSFETAIYVNPPDRYDNLRRRLKEEEYLDHYLDPTQARTEELILEAKGLAF